MSEQTVVPASGAPGPRQPQDLSVQDLRLRIAEAMTRTRERSAVLTEAVDDADLVRQHSPLMSPLVWDLAHVGNQEELWLVRDAGGRAAVRCDIDDMYDAFKHSRAVRPSLPLLRPQETRAYVRQVRDKALDVLDRVSLEGSPLTQQGFVFGMIVQHEQQHDETMLATHQLRSGPPVLGAPPAPQVPGDRSLPDEVLVSGGPFTMGTSTDPWALDNERPAHQVQLGPFWLDTVPVINQRYAAFVAAGGYTDRRWWHPAGWTHLQEQGLSAPLTWRRDSDGSWWRDGFGAVRPLVPTEPVVHVCWYEADAFARWCGRRLPSEAEWEKAARWHPASARSRRFPWGDEDARPEHANLDQRHLGPAGAGAYPAGAAPCGAEQLLGDVWEWTSSDFRPYPGFAAFPYREYSEVFFDRGYKVLRGGSFGTAAGAVSATFRNWDLPVRRQIFAGFRTARDAGPADGEGA